MTENSEAERPDWPPQPPPIPAGEGAAAPAGGPGPTAPDYAGPPDYAALSSPVGPDGPPPPTRPRRRRWMAIGAVAAAVVLAAGGVAAARIVSTLSGTDSPGLASALPRETIAFAQVNLDPNADQKLAMYTLGRRFPDVKDAISDSDPANSLIDYVIARFGDDEAGVTWEDIRSWAGVRAGVAMLATPDSEPYPLLAIQVEDAGKAQRGLAALQNRAGGDALVFRIVDDYAYVSDTDAHLNDALDALARGALDRSPDFAPAAATVGDGDVFGAYVNIAALAPVAQRSVDAVLAELEASLSELGLDPSGASGTGADLQLTYDLLCPGGQPADPSLVQADCDALADLIDGGGLGTLDESLDAAEQSLVEALDQLRGVVSLHIDLNGAGGRLIIDAYGTSDGGSAGPAPRAADIAGLPADSEVAIGVAGLNALMQGSLADGGEAALDALLVGSGVTVDDLLAIVGDDAALSLRDLMGGSPEWGVIVTGADAATATSVLGDLLAGSPAVLGGSGDSYTIAGSADYGDELRGGALGEQALFRSAVPDAAGASLVVFVNVGELLAGSGDEAADQIAALGLTARATDDGAHIELSIVLR